MASRRLIWPSIMLCPGRRVGVLEIGHEHLRTGVERVDHHLAIGRSGDLDPAIAQIRRNRRARPIAVADVLRFRQENRATHRDRAPPDAACRRSRHSMRRAPNAPLQFRHESERIGRKDLIKSGSQFALDFYAGWEVGHHWFTISLGNRVEHVSHASANCHVAHDRVQTNSQRCVDFVQHDK